MTLKKKILTFFPVEKKQEALILQWLDKPHVREFFYGVGLQNTINDLRKFVAKQNHRFDSWISYCGGEPFGYLMTSIVKESEANDENSPLAKWIEPGKKMITLDLLIGEEKYLGKGLAHQMIKEFLLDKFSDTSIVFIDPGQTNTKAIHVYEKAGFEKLEQFIPSWDPVLHWQMRMKVEKLKKNR